MIRSLIAGITISLAGVSAHPQQAANFAQQTTATSSQLHSDFVDRAELLRRIAEYEAVAQRAEAVHSTDSSLTKVYVQLGGMYMDIAMYPKAEDAMRRAIGLLRNGPPTPLAEEMGHLAEIHIATGDLRAAEKEQLEALKIRESAGDPVGIALTWTDLASLYVKEHQYRKAVDFAQRAMGVLADNPQVRPEDRIAIRQILGTALAESHDYVHAIPILKDAVAMAADNFGSDSLSAAMASYVLGYAYWQSGDTTDAAEPLTHGMEQMKAALGWGHPVYVNLMKQYARFLREHGQLEAAAVAEREIRQATAVVDANSLTTRASAFASPQ